MTKAKEAAAQVKHGSTIRISDNPVRVTLDDGQEITLRKGRGRFRVVLQTEKPIKGKGRSKPAA